MGFNSGFKGLTNSRCSCGDVWCFQ